MTPKEKLNAIYELIKNEHGDIFDNIKNIMGATKESKRFDKPTIQEIVTYCEEKGNGIDGEQFWHFYESKDWKIGKTPMKSWKSAIVTWEKSRKENNKVKPKTNSYVLAKNQKDELLDIMAKTSALTRGSNNVE